MEPSPKSFMTRIDWVCRRMVIQLSMGSGVKRKLFTKLQKENLSCAISYGTEWNFNTGSHVKSNGVSLIKMRSRQPEAFNGRY